MRCCRLIELAPLLVRDSFLCLMGFMNFKRPLASNGITHRSPYLPIARRRIKAYLAVYAGILKAEFESRMEAHQADDRPLEVVIEHEPFTDALRVMIENC